MTVARENNLENPSQLIVGQKLRLTISSDSRAKTTRTTTSSRSSSVSKSSATSAAAVTPVTTTTPSTSTTNSQKTVQQATASSDASMFGWPADGQVIESYGLTNKGIDIGGKNGTSVKAAAKGTVMFIGAPKGYGNLIIVRHSGDYVTAYGQLAKILVKQGDTVEKGEKIAEMGTSAEKGARVHFEIRKKGKPLDPSTLLPKV